MRSLFSAASRTTRAWRRFASGAAAFAAAAVLLSCAGDSTSPHEARYARGISFNSVFPSTMLMAGASDLVAFTKVHIVLNHADGSVALDTVVNFPADSSSITLSLNVRLADNAPSTGEPMDLNLGYINATGDTVFKGGPTPILATISVPGSTAPTPVTIPIVYSGAGSNAKAVKITQRTLNVDEGKPFTLTADALDANNAPIAKTPIFWTTLDPGYLSLPTLGSGSGTALAKRGTARVVATLVTGQADTVVVTVLPIASAIAIASGNNQTVPVTNTVAALAQPLVVKVTAPDGLGIAGTTVTFAAATGGGSVAPTTAITDTAGLAQTTWTPGHNLGSQTATATATGLTGSPVTFTATGTAPTATKLGFATAPAPNATVAAGANIPIVVAAEDVDGNTVTTFNGAVTLSVTPNPTALAGTLTVTAVNGVATFTDISIGTAAANSVLTASATGLTAATRTFNVGVGQNHWVITQQPGTSQTSGVNITPAIKAELRDPGNAIVTSYTGAATLVINANPGSATLFGTTTVSSVAGVATFSAVDLDKSGTGYTLDVTATGTTAGTTNAFNVAAGTAKNLTLVSGDNQSGTFGTALPQPIIVKVTDAQGNPVAGKAVTFSVTAGGGSPSPGVNSDANGLASVTWTLGLSGAQTMSIASSGLTGSPILVKATGSLGTIANTSVSPKGSVQDTLTSLTATLAMSAVSHDANNNTIASATYTWTSRNTAAATVSGTGVVTAVANGNSYIVATENGGTKDSALIVVQQRIATINVTPGARSIYTSGNFTFTAQAVDGKGVAMSSQPTFTWTSTQVSVATVGASSGIATGITIGSTQIKATAGTTVGVANLSVLSPITRIDVSFDSTNAVAPDTFSMPSLGIKRMYRAIARDTLLNVMNGISFTWASSNPSVALVDSTSPDGTKGRAVSAANGITNIRATAQGITGAATLYVAQVLSSIDLAPASATVAVAGSTSLVARGKDANGRFISGGTFTFASSLPSVATVNSSSGVVTGVNNGTTNITATSGTITSNAAVITVNNSGPSIISFGRDTLGVGRGNSVSVPILLSKPFGTNVKINLAVGDTTAFWSASSVTITAGQTSVNATLNGHNAGTTTVTATDGSGAGYTTASAIVAVQANVKFTTTGYSLNATDQLSTQVLLSDPSPAGGTYIAFNYGTSGRASISPDPAFIPGGQLASDVVIRGLAAGTTSITPVATGVNGSSTSVTVYASNIVLGYHSQILGSGQFDPNQLAEVSAYMNNPLVITLASTDTTIVTGPPSVTIGTNAYYNYYNIAAGAVGKAKIVATAAGWRPDTTIIISTTPRVITSGGYALNSTAGTQTIYVYSADSVRTPHNRTNSLAVRVSSSDTTVMKVIDTLVTIAAGTSNVSNVRVIPAGAGGVAWIRVSASGHLSDSTAFTVTGPALTLSYTTNQYGVGQEDANVNVQIPNPIATPVVVTLTSSDSSLVAAPQTVTIPSGTYYAYFTLRGKALGTAKLVATAVGYTPDTGTTLVSAPKIKFAFNNSLTAYSTLTSAIYVEDAANTVHNRTAALPVTFTSSDTTIVKIDTGLTVSPGTYYVQPTITAVSTALVPTTAKIIATAPGQTPDTLTITVNPAKLVFSWTTFNVGIHEHRLATGDQNIQLPNSRGVAVPITLTQKQPSIVTLSTTTPTVPGNSYYQYFGFGGLAEGKDTIIATSPGYLPDTGFVTVSSSKLVSSGLPGTATTTSPPTTMTLYTADSVGSSHYLIDSLAIHAVSSDSTVLKPGKEYFHIAKDAFYAQPTVTFVGPGTASITYTDSAGLGFGSVTTNTVTVTGPALSLPGNIELGMRQQSSPGSYYVSVPNNVTNALTVSLASTGTRVATVPASVTIPAGGYFVYFQITSQDTIGTIQIQATATGYTAAAANVQVTVPKLLISTNLNERTTSPKSTIYVYATDKDGNIHYVSKPLSVTLVSSDPTVAAIDSTTVTLLPGIYDNTLSGWTPGKTGTVTITASDTTSAFYKYAPSSVVVTVATPAMTLSFANLSLGLGQNTGATGVYAEVPDYTTSALTVPIGHAANPATTSPANVVIPNNAYFQYFRVTAGTTIGTDTITLSPSGFTPATGAVSVALGHVDPLQGFPSTLKVGDSVQVTMYARDLNQQIHYVSAATTFTLTPNANIQFVSGGAVITSATIPADQQYVQFYIKGVAAGTGSASIANANYVSYSNTLTVTP